MAEARIEFGVSAEVQLHPDEKTAAWLKSLGWTPPVEEPCVWDDPVAALDSAEYAVVEAKRMRSQGLYYKVTRKAGFEPLDALLESLGVDLFWLKRPGADSV